MIVNVNATNKINGEVTTYKLEGDGAEGFLYEGTHMQEVADNIIREINNNLILLGSPIYTIKPGECAAIEAKTFDIEIDAE